MNEHYSLILPVNPIGKQVARITASGTFTPKKTRQAMAKIKSFAWKTYEGPLFDEPLKVTMYFYFRRLKSHKNRRFPSTKPDCDNCCKLVADALEGIIWKNDSRIVDLRLGKVYCTEKQDPHITVAVSTLRRKKK